MKKVIIADDIRVLIEKERSFLNRAGFKIFGAAANSEVLALHKAEKADLVIAKLDTPEMSGEILCSIIRDDNALRSVSIIIVSSGTPSDIERCLQCKANAYISSPVNIKVLLLEAQKLLHIAPRVDLRVPVSVKLNGEKKEKTFSGSIENMSTSGMLFESDFILFEGDVVRCSFSLPNASNISAAAEIVRVVEKENENGSNRYGIRFTKLSADALSNIEALIKKKYKHA